MDNSTYVTAKNAARVMFLGGTALGAGGKTVVKLGKGKEQAEMVQKPAK